MPHRQCNAVHHSRPPNCQCPDQPGPKRRVPARPGAARLLTFVAVVVRNLQVVWSRPTALVRVPAAAWQIWRDAPARPDLTGMPRALARWPTVAVVEGTERSVRTPADGRSFERGQAYAAASSGAAGRGRRDDGVRHGRWHPRRPGASRDCRGRPARAQYLPVGAEGVFCKHCVAVALAWLADGAAVGEPRSTPMSDPWLRAFLRRQDQMWLGDRRARRHRSCAGQPGRCGGRSLSPSLTADWLRLRPPASARPDVPATAHQATAVGNPVGTCARHRTARRPRRTPPPASPSTQANDRRGPVEPLAPLCQWRGVPNVDAWDTGTDQVRRRPGGALRHPARSRRGAEDEQTESSANAVTVSENSRSARLPTVCSR